MSENQPTFRAVPSSKLQAVARDLGQHRGSAYWNRLEEVSQEPALRELLDQNFPSQALRLQHGLSRRSFLQNMGASLALAGLVGCTRQPKETIVPYAANPESTIPGKPLFYATAVPNSGDAQGLLVESHMGRPTKIEGNPEHPSNRGATDGRAQAAILDLYDPDRSRAILRAGRIETWDSLLTALGERTELHRANQGQGLRILSEAILSPTLAAQRRALLEEFPQARWHQWQAIHRDAARAGALSAFGRDLTAHYRLENADVVLVLDGDVLTEGPGALTAAREFARRRKPDQPDGMNRLYVVESSPTSTGTLADHRIHVKPSEVELVARQIAFALGVDGAADVPATPTSKRAAAIADDLRQRGTRAVVIPGHEQSAAVHHLAAAINRRLGAEGSTVDYTEPCELAPDSAGESILALTEDMRAGSVDTLLVLGGNPVYTVPSQLDFGRAIEQVPFTLSLASHEDETSRRCLWHVPAQHFLESWSDVRAHDGTCTVIQPLIAPLYDGRSAHELVAAISGQAGRSAHDLVRATWRASRDFSDDRAFEDAWQTALHDGVFTGAPAPARVEPELQPLPKPSPTPPAGIELVLRADPSVLDGRHANNGWLQEQPRALSLLTWDNVAWLSVTTARRIGVEAGDHVEVKLDDGTAVVVPAWPMPGHAHETVTLHLGYGRQRAGAVGNGVGVDVTPLRSVVDSWQRTGVQVRRVEGKTQLATVQDHAKMEGRDLARQVDLVSLLENNEADHSPGSHASDPTASGDTHGAGGGHGKHDVSELSMYPDMPAAEHAWGMVIDLNSCLGCNACMVGCQAENNVPVVGKEEVLNGREMHWLRIDRYYEGDDDNPDVHHQPVPCMHCEQAPCEVVCPVAATVHSPEGLNEMVYNRCVGTRYCSNNCPYKVRRFNFFQYADTETESLKLGRNPDVTVRTRGVMEKCTYCVQRINQARIDAKKEGRPIADGEFQTACEAVCPTQSITFGNINDEESRVSHARRDPRHYALLEELGTRPRTTYLARVRNPNPAYPA